MLRPLVQASAAHQVLPLVRRRLVDEGLGDEIVAAGLGAQVEAATMGAVAQHLRVDAELAQLVPLLDAVGAAWVVVKGRVLAELAYDRPELRSYADLDVLVDPRHFGDVVDALERAGATLLDRNWSLLHERGLCEASMQLTHGTYLDLHWHLVTPAAARRGFQLDTAALLARRRMVSIRGIAVPTLDAEDTLLHVALHGTLSGGHRLSWVKDVERLVARGDVDWDAFVARARASRVTLPVGVMLRRAHRLLGAPVPRAVLGALDHPRAGAIALAAVERFATPETLLGTHHTGQILMLTARADTTSTLVAVAGELRRKLLVRLGGQAPEPSHDDDGDPDGRRLYLGDLASFGELAPRGRAVTGGTRRS
ncbi:MAG: nucleotidyltransferase domain-containing protein [Acidimicrobiales bacterium]